ncbi:MAG TPA: hypothetical protein VMT18_02350 [Planctomycetota bacterium]|nr:hypothetical protein [Planctomycetota bacterium]
MHSRLGFARLAPLALPLALAGCSKHYTPCTTCDDTVVYETEINDTAAQADWMGLVYPGDMLSIRGHVTQFGPDQFDGFAFVTGAPLSIDLELWADVHGADLDLCVWDPVFGTYVACFETASHPESGQVVILEANKEFHLVVRSFHGDSAYWLDVFGGAAFYGAQALEFAGEQRVPGVWEAYGAHEGPRQEVAPGRAALVLDIAQDGSLLDARPARVVALDGWH